MSRNMGVQLGLLVGSPYDELSLESRIMSRSRESLL